MQLRNVKSEVQGVSKKMNDSEMSLFGVYESLFCLTILYCSLIWDVRVCLGITGNALLSVQCTL